MDRKLVGWACRVKARGGAGGLPPLWLFTDAARLRDPLSAIARLPCGLAGVVLRDAGARPPGQARRIARLCRARRLALSVSDPAWAARLAAGLHASRGVRQGSSRFRFVTSSAHDAREFARGRKLAARIIFLSPVFMTASHPRAQPLGFLRWSALAGIDRSRVAALGGVDDRTIGRLPGWTRHAGAIGALS